MSNPGKLFKGPAIDFTLPDCSVSEFFLPLYRNINPGKIVQINGVTGEKQTAREVLTTAIQFAEGLTTRKFGDQSVVAALGFNSSNLFTVIAGCVLNNTPHFPMDPSMKQYEIERMFMICKPSVVFTEIDSLKHVLAALESCRNTCEVFLLNSNETVSERARPFKEFLRLDADIDGFKARSVKNPKETTAYILGSSGTTGSPKAMEITHANSIYTVHIWKPGMIEKYDTYFQVTNPFWVTGHFAVHLTPVYGCKRVFVGDLTPDNLISAIDKYKPDGGFIHPLHLNWIATHPQFEKYDVSCIKYFEVGGTPLTQASADIVKSKWRRKDFMLTQIYGSTETTGPITSPDSNVPIACAGKVATGMTAKVVNASTAELLGPNETGELCFKSEYGMTKGYMNNPEATAEAFDEDGFYRSGDLGYIDENNAIFITGRRKDLIKYRSHQVAPIELEEVISEMQGVQEVTVVGLPHEVDLYHACAAVVKVPGSRLTEKDVIDYVAEKLSETKHLYGGVKFFKAIPRNNNGKALREQVKEMLMKK